MTAALVQYKSVQARSSGTCGDTIVLDATPTVGNVLVCTIAVRGNNAPTCSDFTEWRSLVGTSNDYCWAGYRDVIGGDDATFSVSASDDMRVIVSEWSGLASGGPTVTDLTTTGTGSGSQTIGTVNATGAGLVIGFHAGEPQFGEPAVTPGSGWTAFAGMIACQNVNPFNINLYKIVTTSGNSSPNYDAGWQNGLSLRGGVAFWPEGGGGGGGGSLAVAQTILIGQ